MTIKEWKFNKDNSYEFHIRKADIHQIVRSKKDKTRKPYLKSKKNKRLVRSLKEAGIR